MLVVAWPILTAIKTSFTDPDTGGFTFDNYKYFFETPRELTNILFTLGIVFLTVALAIVLAYLLALYLRFVKSKVSRLIGNLYLLPQHGGGVRHDHRGSRFRSAQPYFSTLRRRF